MGKREKYKWKDSNMALVGSDIDRKIKEASAEGEEAWTGLGGEPVLRVWRIEQFKVVEWPKAKHGQFHKGDSYIVLHTYRRPAEAGKEATENDPLAHDVYFWIGEESSQDEYGTAAYKTVELDTFLKDAAVQHREVQGRETDEFLALFGGRVRYLKGGVDSGFNHVEPESYETRLLQLKGRRKNVVVRERKPRAKCLNAGDCFILDQGTRLTAWLGSSCNKDERSRCAELLSTIKGERSEVEVETDTVDQGSESDDFWEALGGKTDVSESDGDDAEEVAFTKVVFRLSDAKKEGKLQLKKEAEDKFPRTVLDSDDVFIIDTGFQVFVHIGKGASKDERTDAIPWAHKYIAENDRPANLPVTRIVEGQHCAAFEAVFDANATAAAGDKAEEIKDKAMKQVEKLKKKKKCVIQ